jgi:hypothetical protein
MLHGTPSMNGTTLARAQWAPRNAAASAASWSSRTQRT